MIDLDLARKRFQQAAEEEREIRDDARADLRFRCGEQWDEEEKRIRSASKRPALTFNRLPTFIAQVANEARQNKPQIRFSPAEDGDQETAEVFEGLARHIQYASKADVAYETALDYSTSGSFGYFRLLTDYADPKGFDQEIKFAPICDPFSVYGLLVPACKNVKPRWAFVCEDVPQEEYKRLYPKSELVSLGFDTQRFGDWVSRDSVRIAEYWTVETKKRTLLLLVDGSTVYEDEVDVPKELIQDSRTVEEDVVRFCKINGCEVLAGSETEWVGDRIPIFAVLGPHLIVDNKPQVFSLVRFARDPQRLINFYKSGVAEQIALTNRAPYIGFKGQFKDPRWQNANRVNYAYLEVESQDANGQPVGLPQRNQYEAPIQAMSVAAAQEIDDLKATIGIFDPSLGAESNEKSGIAIQRRQAQSGLTNFHFLDNLARAQSEAGDALAYMIPRVYDAPRTVRILGEDESAKVVRINQPDESGKTFMLTAGKYDVTVSTGPSYTTKRQETVAVAQQIISAAPQLMGVIGDIYFRNSDMAGSNEIAERMKKFIAMTSPGLIEEQGDKPDPQQKLMQMQAQMQGLMQQHEQLIQTVNQQADEIKTRRFDLESKERIEMGRLELQREVEMAKIALEQAKLAQAGDIEGLWAQLEAIKQQMQAEQAQRDQEFQAAQFERQAEVQAEQQAQQAEQAKAQEMQ